MVYEVYPKTLPASGNQGQTFLNLSTQRIEPRIAGGHERMLENSVADEDTTRPTYAGMTVMLRQIEHAGFSRKEA